MKLRKIYCSHPDIFPDIEFNDGFSVILGEIRLPQNQDRDTHNLGKTTLAQLLDFMLMRGANASFFLVKHASRFEGMNFYLEVELSDARILTILRTAQAPHKTSLLVTTSGVDARTAKVVDWNHLAVAFNRAKALLDSYFAFEALNPWDFRKEVGYLLRTQNDYRDVFQLDKHKSRHKDWKPPLARVLGFDAIAVEKLYEKRDDRDALDAEVKRLEAEFQSIDQNASTIEGLLAVKQSDIEREQILLGEFSFAQADESVTRELVDELDVRISALNEERYLLAQLLARVEVALRADRIEFDTTVAATVFKEAGIYFDGQLKKDFDQLIAFNRAISLERQEGLREEQKDLSTRMDLIDAELRMLDDRRSEHLRLITAPSALAAFRASSSRLVKLQADVEVLQRQRERIGQLRALRTKARVAEEEYKRFQQEVDDNVSAVNADSRSLFSTVRRYFDEIIFSVLKTHAVLAVDVNGEGNLEFRAEVLDEAGTATSRDRGNTYKKLLCIAFDLAILRAHLGSSFPRFAYHDGAFESLDRRKKVDLLAVFRDYGRLGLQPIVTVIDSDFPADTSPSNPFVRASEVVRTLHDEGQDGLLFRMASW